MCVKEESQYSQEEKEISDYLKEKNMSVTFFKDEEDKTFSVQGIEGKEESFTISGKGKFLIMGEPEFVGTMLPRPPELSIHGQLLDKDGNIIPVEKMTEYEKSYYDFLQVTTAVSKKLSAGKKDEA